jgi:hypothetical protein
MSVRPPWISPSISAKEVEGAGVEGDRQPITRLDEGTTIGFHDELAAVIEDAIDQ